jgi:hypothetical protein
MTSKYQQPAARFAICVNTDDPDLLTPRMVYRVLPDNSAAESDYIRVIDNEGEDYLYPAKYLVQVDLPQPVKRALLRTRVPVIRGLYTGRGRSASTSRKRLATPGRPPTR